MNEFNCIKICMTDSCYEISVKQICMIHVTKFFLIIRIGNHDVIQRHALFCDTKQTLN